MLYMAKFCSAIKQRKLSCLALADSMGVNRSTFYRKLRNGGDSLMLWEIESIIKKLELTGQDALEIFLS